MGFRVARRGQDESVVGVIDPVASAMAVFAGVATLLIAFFSGSALVRSTATIGFASDVQYAELQPVRLMLLDMTTSEVFSDWMAADGHPVERLEFLASESFEPLAWFDLTVEGDDRAEVLSAAEAGAALLISWINEERDRLGDPGAQGPQVSLLRSATEPDRTRALLWAIVASVAVALFVLAGFAASRLDHRAVQVSTGGPNVSGVESMALRLGAITALRRAVDESTAPVSVAGEPQAVEAVLQLVAGFSDLAGDVVAAANHTLESTRVLAVSAAVSSMQVDIVTPGFGDTPSDKVLLIWVPVGS